MYRNDSLATRKGFTLIEIAVSSLVVALMLVAALNMFGTVARDYDVTGEYQMGHLLGEDLMQEILQQCYADPGDPNGFGVETGESTTSRVDFDDIDDYDGWSCSPPRMPNGTALSGTEGWTRSAAVCWADVLSPGTNAASETGLKRVDVAVTSPRGRTFTLRTLHCSTGRLELQPPADRTFVVGLTTKLQAGTEQDDVIVEHTALSNHAEDQ